LSKPDSKEDYPFGPEPAAIKVASKIFALISYKDISLKCDPFMAQSLRDQYTSITPGNFLNKDDWNTIKIDGSIPEDELYWMITHSYELVLKSLTKEEKDSADIS
jgi:predicted DNA-binding protein (MmcQ/YjbR family)